MKKLLLSLLVVLAASQSANAQFKVVEDFESNKLEWTEAPKGYSGSAIIDKGVMTLTSRVHKSLTANFEIDRIYCSYETHCYVPLNLTRPFSIISNVTIGELDDEDMQEVGLLFNYMDYGNYDAFIFNESNITYLRIRDEKRVGHIYQGMKWNKKRKAKQEWKLEYDGNYLLFYVDEIPLFKVKHVELKYDGFGFYAGGKQKLVIDDITFEQN